MERKSVLMFAAGFIAGLLVACAVVGSVGYYRIADLNEQLAAARAGADQNAKLLRAETNRHALNLAEMKDELEKLELEVAHRKKQEGQGAQNK
jgi:hypothetical protein